MKYLNTKKLNEINHIEFQNSKPYPWLNPEGLLTEEGYKTLLDNLPDLSLFKKSFGLSREYGQKPHDRYELMYNGTQEISKSWKEFLYELESKEYKKFIEKLFNAKNFKIRFQWQYSVKGYSVSPHCDSGRKLGVHIFYLNTSNDWDKSWGGETLILYDKKPEKESVLNPEFEDFKGIIAAKSLDNYSLIFVRTDKSWHGVKELNCPPDKIRKIFSVVIEKSPSFKEKVKGKLKNIFSKFYS